MNKPISQLRIIDKDESIYQGHFIINVYNKNSYGKNVYQYVLAATISDIVMDVDIDQRVVMDTAGNMNDVLISVVPRG